LYDTKLEKGGNEETRALKSLKTCFKIDLASIHVIVTVKIKEVHKAM
jgi:hypothetical protein